MQNYLEDFQRLSGQITASARGGISKGFEMMSEFDRAQALSAQKSAAARRKQEGDLYKSLYKDRKTMFAWQTKDIDSQSNALVSAWENQSISDEEMMREIQGINTASEEYHKFYEAAMGDPDDPGNAGTYYGNINGIKEWSGSGVNPYADQDQIPVGFQSGKEGIAAMSNDRENKLQQMGMGLTGSDQWIKGYHDEFGEWQMVFGNPSDETTWKTIPRKGVYGKLPTTGAFVPELAHINLRTMPEVASQSQVKNVVGQRENVDEGLNMWFNNELATNKKFKREVWGQFGEAFFGDDESKLKQSKDRWLTEGLMDIPYDPSTYSLDFSGIDAGYEEMVNAAKDEFSRSYKDQNSRDLEPTDSQATSGDNKIIPVEFNHADAFEDIFRQTNQSGPVTPQLSMSMEDFDQLEPMVGTPSGITLNLGADKLVGATMVNRGPEGDIGKLVGQYKQTETVEVLDTSKLSEEEAAEYRAQGKDWMIPMMNKTVDVFYYKVLNESDTESFYKALGVSMKAPQGEALDMGRKYMLEKYGITS